jgi:hypothetical protein
MGRLKKDLNEEQDHPELRIFNIDAMRGYHGIVPGLDNLFYRLKGLASP